MKESEENVQGLKKVYLLGAIRKVITRQRVSRTSKQRWKDQKKKENTKSNMGLVLGWGRIVQSG